VIFDTRTESTVDIYDVSQDHIVDIGNLDYANPFCLFKIDENERERENMNELKIIEKINKYQMNLLHIAQ